MFKILVQYWGKYFISRYSNLKIIYKNSVSVSVTNQILRKIFQNDGGEIKYFAVNKLDNSNNNKATNVWSLQNPKNQDWQEGSVSVSSDGDIQYQVSIHKIEFLFVFRYNNKKLSYHTYCKKQNIDIIQVRICGSPRK